MDRLGDTKEHYWLVQRMLRETGSDAVAAFEAGDLTAEDWASVIAKCRTCTKPGSCRAWLDAADAPEPRGQRDAPAFCLNRKLFESFPERDPEEV